MFCKRKFLPAILFSLFLMGCAEPKYVNALNQSQPEPNPQELKADCLTKFSKSGLCLSWYWEKRPISTESGSLVFKTYRLNLLDQTPVETELAGPPQVVLWMPSMGHGSTPVTTEQIDVGTFRGVNVFFIMPGDWEIRFQVKIGNEIIDETQVNIVF